MQDDHDQPDDLMHSPPAYPPIVRIAAIIWIVMGSVILLFALCVLLSIGTALGQEAARPFWRPQPGHPMQDPLFWAGFFLVEAAFGAFVICAVFIVGFNFVFTGYQTLTGKATDTQSKAIWSLLIGFAELAYAGSCFNHWMGANARVQGMPVAPHFPIVLGFPFVIGIHVLGGFVFLAAAAMAARGRDGYKTWRRWFKRS
jgi:hypothetical protein